MGWRSKVKDIWNFRVTLMGSTKVLDQVITQSELVFSNVKEPTL